MSLFVAIFETRRLGFIILGPRVSQSQNTLNVSCILTDTEITPIQLMSDATPTLHVAEKDSGSGPLIAPIPTFRVIEPTPIKDLANGISLSSVSSPPALLPSHRVLYRGSLSFSGAEHDIPLEGTYRIAHHTCF